MNNKSFGKLCFICNEKVPVSEFKLNLDLCKGSTKHSICNACFNRLNNGIDKKEYVCILCDPMSRTIDSIEKKKLEKIELDKAKRISLKMAIRDDILSGKKFECSGCQNVCESFDSDGDGMYEEDDDDEDSKYCLKCARNCCKICGKRKSLDKISYHKDCFEDAKAYMKEYYPKSITKEEFNKTVSTLRYGCYLCQHEEKDNNSIWENRCCLYHKQALDKGIYCAKCKRFRLDKDGHCERCSYKCRECDVFLTDLETSKMFCQNHIHLKCYKCDNFGAHDLNGKPCCWLHCTLCRLCRKVMESNHDVIDYCADCIATEKCKCGNIYLTEDNKSCGMSKKQCLTCYKKESYVNCNLCNKEYRNYLSDCPYCHKCIFCKTKFSRPNYTGKNAVCKSCFKK
jgi:hypothetical protein